MKGDETRNEAGFNPKLVSSREREKQHSLSQTSVQIAVSLDSSDN